MNSQPPRPGRRLIINADDFGLSAGVNAGIALAHAQGVLTSATLLANAPFFTEAVALAAALPRLGVGLHLNLVRGRPLSPPGEVPLLTGADDGFRPFRLRRMSVAFLEQAEREYRRQFERILGAGLIPTHIDFEKHHAWRSRLYGLAGRLAAEYGVGAARILREPVAWAVRNLGWPGWRRASMAAALRVGVNGEKCALARPDRFLGQTHIGMMTESVWLRLISSLPPGTSEVMTHPGEAEPASDSPRSMGKSWLSDARERELAALLSTEVRDALALREIECITFRDLSAGS